MFFSGFGKRIPKGCPQSVSDPPTYCIRAAGVLRYNRESDNHRINLTILPEVQRLHFNWKFPYRNMSLCYWLVQFNTQSQPLTEYPVKCEYCGLKAPPSLDLPWAQGPEVRKKVNKQISQMYLMLADLLASSSVSILDRVTLLLCPAAAAV